MVIKWLIISIAFFYIKVLSFLFFLYILLVNNESEKILKKKSYKLENRYTNYCFKPKTLDEVPNDLPIGTILYYIYWNNVFDLTYVKILHKKEKILNKILNKIFLKQILKSLLLVLIGLNRLLIKITINVLRYNDKKLEEYLLKNFIKSEDDRMLIKINNEWDLNGLKSLIDGILRPSLKTIGDDKKDIIIKKAIEIVNEKKIQINEINHETLMYKATFKDIKTKIPHSVYIESTKDLQKVGYETDYEKAISRGNYDCPVLINEFDGPKKITTLLSKNKEDFIMVEDPKLVSAMRQYKGALVRGYNVDLISEKYDKSIKTIGNNMIEIKTELLLIGIDDEIAEKIIVGIIDDISLK